MDGPMTELAPLAAAKRGATMRNTATRAPTHAPGRPLAVVFNPTAGRRKAKRLAAALELLRDEGAALDLEHTAARGDAERLARGTPQSQILIVAGGDGTANEAANGRLAAGGGRLALIPLGTANVLAAELGIEDLRQAAQAATKGRPLICRPGIANGRAFVMMAGVGFDAHVVAGVSPRLKRLLGKGAYVLEMLRQLLVFPFPTYRVSIDGVEHEAASVVVARGRYYGGRFIVAPEARLDRAELHVCLFRRGGVWRTIRYALALALGKLPGLSDIEIVTARRVVIDGPAGDPVQGDGDIIARLPVTIELSPVALELMRP
jgi:YegS/Rv2252/BmrU family lipid kinase